LRCHVGAAEKLRTRPAKLLARYNSAHILKTPPYPSPQARKGGAGAEFEILKYLLRHPLKAEREGAGKIRNYKHPLP
jgi:hypothetical protein